MAEAHKWPDVHLLSFDLQTVKFAYADDYTLSITPTDPLATDGGSYDLRFGRRLSDGARNPHTDSEPFLRGVLRHDQLAKSLHTLVALLRATLPVAKELMAIETAALQAGHPVHTLVKGSRWHRVLYGDFR
jgi:mediator of RNA polymerase II transcription subunit 14